MEKMEIRAYTFDDLVGSCGGYIGLFLGYSLIQIPKLIDYITRTKKRKINSANDKKMCKSTQTENIDATPNLD